MNRIIILVLGLLTSIPTFGQNPQMKILDSLFTTLHKRNTFNGNVLIADKGKIILKQSYGLADEEAKRKLNEQSIFELASVSKQFTAMAIVILQKKGKLKYEDKISKYIPELNFYEDVTIKHLLNHTSGLPDYMDLFEDKWDKSKFATNQDIVNEFAKYKPEARFKPNEKFEYSNTGYALLAIIIERLSKKSFDDFLKNSIFKPLKMKNTFVYRSRFKPQKVENYAYGYVLDSLGRKVRPDSFGKSFYAYYLDGIVGDGMVNSTVEDLFIWDRALYTNKLINDDDRSLIYQSSITSDGKDNKYGFGWFIKEDEKYGKIVNHSGSWVGYATFIERHLTNDKTIILLQNNRLRTTKLPIKEIRMVLYNEPLVVEKLIELKTEDLDKYLGIYSNENYPLKITVSKKGNVLYTQVTGKNEVPMDSCENHIFKFDPEDKKMVFNINDQTFELTQGVMKLVFKKE